MRHHYLAEAFEYHLRLLKHRDRDVASTSETATAVVSGASLLLTRLIAEAKVIDVTSIRRRTLWIGEVAAQRFIDTHARVFTSAQTSTKFWISNGILEPFNWEGVDGFQIKSKEGSSTKALATYWEELLADSSINELSLKFESWLEKADCLPYSGFEAPTLMTTVGREQYLTAALSWIEKNHSVDTADYGSHPPPPADRNPIEFFVWGESVEVQRDRLRGFESENVETLIGQIVKFDSRQTGYEHRCSRIRALLKSSIPSVVCSTAEVIHSLNPQALAWILSDPKTLSLGLALIESASVPESFAWQALNSESRTVKQEEARTKLWEKAVEIACAVFEVGTHEWIPATKAVAVLEVTDYMIGKEEDSERQKYFRPDIGNPRKAAVIKRRKYWLSQLGLARIHARIHNGNRAYSPRVFNELAEPLVSLCAKRKPPRRDQFESMPYTEIELLLWVMNEIAKDSSEKPELENLRSHICETVVTLYADELRREHYGDANYRVTWTSEADIWTGLKWEPVVRILQTANKIDTIIKPIDFEGHVRSLPATTGRELHEIQSEQKPWAMKIRTHLRLLLEIYFEVQHGRESESNHDATRSLVLSVEDEIADLIATFSVDKPKVGRLDIFDLWYESNTFGSSPTMRLIPLISKTINQFDPGKRSRIVKALQINTSDLNRLIGLAGGLRSDGSRAEVEAQIVKVLAADPLKAEHWLTRIEQMALDSANLGLVETSKAILKYGDEVTENHPYRDRWLELAFQIKLVLAFHEEDRQTLTTLAVPEIKEAVKVAGAPSLTERLEHRRKFLLAVLDVKDSPDSAAKQLEGFVANGDESLEYTVNLFRARIEQAKRETGPAMQAKLRDAFAKWEQSKAAGLSLLSDERKSSFDETIAFNELEGLILLHDRSGVMDVLLKTPKQYRLSIPFLKLIVPFLKTEKMESELKALQFEARDFHKSSSGLLTTQWSDLEKLIQHPIEPGERPDLPITTIESEDRLRLMGQWYPTLKSITPRQLVAVIRGQDWSIGKFVLREVICCLQIVLEQDVLFSQFPALKEPEQTLLLAILLKNRLEEWGWTVPPESLGGITTSGSTGRRDLVIEVPGNGKVSVIEALKLTYLDRNSILDHLNRLFSYDPTGDDCGVLISFAKVADQNEFWENYKETIHSGDLKDAPIVGIIEDFIDPSLSFGRRIKIGVSNHQQKGVPKTIYHIVVHVGG